MIHDLDHYDVVENEAQTIALYPNPVRDRLTIKVESLEAVEVYNLMGQQVMISTSSIVDMSGLNQGIYFVCIKADGNTITKRVVKQ